MHGLINTAIQCFVRDTYGAATWAAVMRKTRLGIESFEAMLGYDPAVTDRVVAAAALVLRRPAGMVLEDLGTFLVCSPATQALRRLLRFGGVGFVDFLHSLDDLPDRARLALPQFHLPLMELTEHDAQRYSLRCRTPVGGGGHIMLGLLRAMADDYGALATFEIRPGAGGEDVIAIHLAEEGFAEGRRFDLAAAVA